MDILELNSLTGGAHASPVVNIVTKFNELRVRDDIDEAETQLLIQCATVIRDNGWHGEGANAAEILALMGI